ncbi:MAG: hypothetical protein IH983_02490 [Planctomycetes bacterium]|nr:hypothetical protein [Planctomycetota bacterium]
MPITSTIARHYAWRMIIMAVVFTVLGAWGVYDFAVSIPRQQLLYERSEVLRQCQAALETDQPAGQPNDEATAAIDAISGAIAAVISRHAQQLDIRINSADPDSMRIQLEALQQSIQSSDDVAWIALLSLNIGGLFGQREQGRLADFPAAQLAYTANQDALNALSEVRKPAAYDQIVKGLLFVPCLPMGVSALWMVLVVKRRKFALDEDGTLQLPKGPWKADEIADIDMTRWMAKSVAYVVHRDGARAKLDDYKYRNLHLIVGAIASRLHPGEWTVEAKPIKSSSTTPTAPEALHAQVRASDPASSSTLESPEPTPPGDAS